ncbi:MAG: hypothetical protein ACKOPP_07090 [Bacteroidota bacterium]
MKIITLTNVKTGRTFKMTKNAYDIAKKHGMDKDWDILPNLSKPSAPNPMPIINQHPEIESEPITETKRKRKKSTENGETDNIS